MADNLGIEIFGEGEMVHPLIAGCLSVRSVVANHTRPIFWYHVRVFLISIDMQVSRISSPLHYHPPAVWRQAKNPKLLRLVNLKPRKVWHTEN